MTPHPSTPNDDPSFLTWRKALLFALLLFVAGVTAAVGLRDISIRQLEASGVHVRVEPWAPDWLRDAARMGRLDGLLERTGPVSWVEFYRSRGSLSDDEFCRVCRLNPTRLACDDLEMSHEALSCLSRCTRLSELVLSDCPVPGDVLRHLSSLHQLQRLNLRGTQVDDSGMTFLEQLTSLSSIDLSRTAVTNQGLEQLPLDRVEWLYLSETDLFDAPIARLARARQLYLLDVSHTAIGDAFVAGLDGCDRLNVLVLAGSHVTDAGVASLAALPLAAVDLSDTPITDRGLAPLEASRTLSRVRLSASQVSDESLAILGRCASLNGVILASGPDAEADAQAVEAVKAALPHLLEVRIHEHW